MKYQEGKIGRSFILKFEHGDNLLEDLNIFTQKEELEHAVIYLLGALKKADLVVGPEKCELPPVGINYSFVDGREILAIGTLIPDESNNPMWHIHSSVGRDSDSITACLRGNTEVFLIVEAIVFELLNLNAKRKFDSQLGLKVLDLSNDKK